MDQCCQPKTAVKIPGRGVRRNMLLLLFILCSAFQQLKSQDTLDSYSVDKTSYDLYQEKKWKELVTFVNKALKQDFDYYYLRMRIGIAQYELGNYVAAQKHFEKALEFNSGDELAMEYIYFCYVFTYRYEEARWFSKKFPASLAEKLKTSVQSPIAYAIVEGGAKIADSTHQLSTGHYGHAGLSHYVAKRFSLYHALTYYDQSFTLGQPISGSFNQVQYYLGATVPLGNNWQIAPGAQVLGKNTRLRIDPPPPPPPPPGQPPPKKPIPRDTTIKDNYFVGSVSLRKTFSKLDLSLSTTVSSVFGATQYQHGLLVSWSPLKSRRFVLGCNTYVHTEDAYTTSYVATIPFIYASPVKRLGITASYLMNSGGSNAIESNGYIVNNSADLTTSRISALASVNINKQLDVYGLYQFENKEEAMAHYVYHYNLFVIGIKIRPKE